MRALCWALLVCALWNVVGLLFQAQAVFSSHELLVHVDSILALNGSKATAPFSYAEAIDGSGTSLPTGVYAVPPSHDTSSLVFKFAAGFGAYALTPRATAYDDVCAPKVNFRSVDEANTTFAYIVHYNCMRQGRCFLNVMTGSPDREVIDVRWLKVCGRE